MSEEVARTGQPKALEAMILLVERKIVHYVVAEGPAQRVGGRRAEPAGRGLPGAVVPVPAAPDGAVCEPVPGSAASVFGVALPVAVTYAGLLAVRGMEQGLLGPREVPRLWDRHLLNCAVVAELIDSRQGTLLDLGSGAGLPGLVLAMVLPDTAVTLLEPMERRCRFLTECVTELGLANVTVLRGRAEDVTIRTDVVTARAVARLPHLAELAIGLVRPGGDGPGDQGAHGSGRTEGRRTGAAPNWCSRRPGCAGGAR